MADQVDALGREIPYLILQKAPQLTLQKLRDKYPDGGEMGWYAFVQEYRSFVYWDVDNNQWQPVGNEEVRHLAEQERLAEELLRKEAEGTRHGAEIQRNNAEGIRISNEQGRVTAEGLRMSTHNTAMNEAGEATEAANVAANDATTALRSANLLGTIAHSAAAPTPTSNGFYHFSSGGAVSWLPGAPTVSTGDRVSVSKSGSTYTYTHLPQQDRVLTSPQSLTKAQQEQVKSNIGAEGADFWELETAYLKPTSASHEGGGEIKFNMAVPHNLEIGEEVRILYLSSYVDSAITATLTNFRIVVGLSVQYPFADAESRAEAIVDNIGTVRVIPLSQAENLFMNPKDKNLKLKIDTIKDLPSSLSRIESKFSAIDEAINSLDASKVDIPSISITLKKAEIEWENDWVLIEMPVESAVKVHQLSISTGGKNKTLSPIVSYPSNKTFDGNRSVGFLIKDTEGLLSKNTDFKTISIGYDVLGGAKLVFGGTSLSYGRNIVFSESQHFHSEAMVAAFEAVYPEFGGDKVNTSVDALANFNNVNAAYFDTYCRAKKANIITLAMQGKSTSIDVSGNSEIMVVASHYGNDFERHDLTPSATEFLQNVIAVGAAPPTGTPNEDWTSYGFGLEFSEPANNVELNAAYPDVLFTRDVGSATISADKKVLTITHPSLRFTNIIDLEVGGEIGIGRDNFIILEKRTIASIDSPTQLTVTEPFTVSPTPLTLYIDNAKIGTVWQPNASYQNYFQSPVCAIVMAKFRKIQDLSGANWHICRLAARATASQAGAWDMYRGFGVINPDAAVQWIEDNYKSDEYQEMLADQLEGLRGISPFISEGKLKKNSPVPKRIVDELLLEKVNIIPGHLLIPVEELAKVQRIDFTVNKSEPLDEDSIGIWDSEEEKFVGTKISDFKEFLTNTFEASVSKSTTLDPESDEDIPTSKAVATYIAGGLFGQIVEFRIENDMHMYYITKAPYANVDLGQVGFVHRGAYDPLYPYRKLDLVTTTDSSYLYIANSVGIGKAVLNTAYWACIADGKPATQAANAANQAAILANTKAGLANQAAQDANDAADNANNAVDTLLSNVISLELRTDMHLYLTTPDVYDGFTFKISNGRLIAMT